MLLHWNKCYVSNIVFENVLLVKRVIGSLRVTRQASRRAILHDWQIDEQRPTGTGRWAGGATLGWGGWRTTLSCQTRFACSRTDQSNLVIINNMSIAVKANFVWILTWFNGNISLSNNFVRVNYIAKSNNNVSVSLITRLHKRRIMSYNYVHALARPIGTWN